MRQWLPYIHARNITPPLYQATLTALAMERSFLYRVPIGPEMAKGSGFRLPWVLPIEFGDYIGSGIELAIVRVVPV